MTAILRWALWLQQHLGAFVFPVDHPGLPRCAGSHRPGWPCDGKRGKHPCGKWSRDSTSDSDMIRSALSRGLRNVGVDTLKSGLLVVDEDSPRAFTGYAAGIGQVVPETFTVSTAQGNHFYFRQPAGEPLGNGTGALPAGIDIRGRGFVVAPGSLHETGVVYTAADPATPVAPAPDWLITTLRPAAPAAGFRQPAAGRAGVAASAPARLRGVLAVVLSARPPVPGQPGSGERNKCLYWASCRAAEMVDAGELDQAIAIQVLTEAGEATGLGAGAVAATIDSALRRVLT